MRGYFGIGAYYPKKEANIGTLLRSAHAFGAAFVFTIGRRYRTQPSDVSHAARHIPLYHHLTFDEFRERMPLDCQLVGIEMDPRATPIHRFVHPARACYLLGAEDGGLPEAVRRQCQFLVAMRGAIWCLNVAVAGSIVIHDRVAKNGQA